MADLRKETHGPGALKDVNLVVIAYDNRVAKKDGEITTHYLDARIHPGDRRAAGQTTLALVSKPDSKSPSGINNSARYSAGQFASIVEAAGDNVSDLTNKDGAVVGKIYGVQSDLLISGAEVIANTKTLKPTELSVGPDEKGRDIRTQIFDSMREAKAAREAAKNAPEASAEAAVETPAVETPAAEEPKAAKATATKPRTTRKPAVKKAPAKTPALVGAEPAVASVEEPALG